MRERSVVRFRAVAAIAPLFLCCFAGRCARGTSVEAGGGPTASSHEFHSPTLLSFPPAPFSPRPARAPLTSPSIGKCRAMGHTDAGWDAGEKRDGAELPPSFFLKKNGRRAVDYNHLSLQGSVCARTRCGRGCCCRHAACQRPGRPGRQPARPVGRHCPLKATRWDRAKGQRRPARSPPRATTSRAGHGGLPLLLSLFSIWVSVGTSDPCTCRLRSDRGGLDGCSTCVEVGTEGVPGARACAQRAPGRGEERERETGATRTVRLSLSLPAVGPERPLPLSPAMAAAGLPPDFFDNANNELRRRLEAAGGGVLDLHHYARPGRGLADVLLARHPTRFGDLGPTGVGLAYEDVQEPGFLNTMGSVLGRRDLLTVDLVDMFMMCVAREREREREGERKERGGRGAPAPMRRCPSARAHTSRSRSRPGGPGGESALCRDAS